MPSDRRIRLVPIVVVAGLAIAGGARCQDPTTRESLEFSQRKVRANMQELEERMFRLSTLLRDAQPESAARLVLGLKRSREELIVADMDEARAFIAGGKLEEAAERQRVIIVKLEELRRLLLSSDLDLILKLERLRQLTRVRKSLDELEKEEGRQADALEKMGDDATDEKDRMKLDAMREAADEAKRKLEEAVPDAHDAMTPESGVGADLEEARRDQDAARKDLAKGQAKSAAGKKRKAGGGLGEASKKVSSAREQLLEDLQDPIRAAVIDALNQMVRHQEKVAAGIPAPGADTSGVRYQTLRDLERGVVDLARSTRDLVDETEFSVALPSALRLAETFAASSAGSLAASRIDEETRRVGGRLLDDLQSLLKIMNDEAAGAQRAGRPSQGGCKGCANRNKLISELSMVRLLEAGLLSDTQSAESQRSGSREGRVAEIQAAVKTLADRQARTSKVTGTLKTRSCSKCLGTESEDE